MGYFQCVYQSISLRFEEISCSAHDSNDGQKYVGRVKKAGLWFEETHEEHKVSADFSLSGKSNYKTQYHKCACWIEDKVQSCSCYQAMCSFVVVSSSLNVSNISDFSGCRNVVEIPVMSFKTLFLLPKAQVETLTRTHYIRDKENHLISYFRLKQAFLI